MATGGLGKQITQYFHRNNNAPSFADLTRGSQAAGNTAGLGYRDSGSNAPNRAATSGLVGAAKGLSTGLSFAGPIGQVASSLISGTFSYLGSKEAASAQRDSSEVPLRMQQKDYDAAHSVGLVHPSQFQSNGTIGYRNSYGISTQPRTNLTSNFTSY